MSKSKNPNDKQRRFVDEYLVDLNATQAAVRAGYAPRSAQQQSSRLLNKSSIKDAVSRAMAERSRRTGIEADRVLRELARVAFLNPSDVVDFDTGTVKQSAAPDDLAAITSCKVKTSSFGESGESVEREIRLADKLKALDMLCRHLGLYADGKGFTPPGSGDGKETGVVELPAVMEIPPHPVDDEESPSS